MRPVQSGVRPEVEILLPGELHKITQNQVSFLFKSLFNIEDAVFLVFFKRRIKTAK